jgi:hypothetical protein
MELIVGKYSRLIEEKRWKMLAMIELQKNEDVLHSYKGVSV